MRPSSQSPRTPSRLSDSVHRQLNAYALAASAAGVGMLALSKPALAKIVYTHAHIVLRAHSYNEIYLDLNHDGVADFLLSNFYWVSSTLGIECPGSRVAISSAIGGPWNLVVGQSNLASALRAGARIGLSNKFTSVGFLASAYRKGRGSSCPSGSRGAWANHDKGLRNRYLGLRFVIGGKNHFGWARVSMSKYPLTTTVTGYAYETVPNKSIIAGKTKEPDVITVERGGLDRLAHGSAGRLGK